MPSSARGQTTPASRDPLTYLLLFVLRPVLFCLLVVLHFLYYAFLKVIASIRWQRYTFLEVRKRPGYLLDGWWAGIGFRRAGRRTADRASEERLLLRGNRVRTMGRFDFAEDEVTQGKSKKQKALAPRHLAVVLAEKPVRTSMLLLRAATNSLFGQRNLQVSLVRRKEEDREQLSFAMKSIETILRCSAITGIEEVTLYDPAGRIKAALAGQQQWLLESHLDRPWEDSPGRHDSVFDTPCTTSIISSLPPTPQSYSSALDITPTLSTKPSSTALSSPFFQPKHLDELLISDPVSRLHIKALLRSPSYATESSAGPGVMKSNGNGFSHIDTKRLALVEVNLLGPEDSKEALARAASKIATTESKSKVIDVQTVDNALKEFGYPSEPDLLIIHGGPRRVRTLHGFPPWMIRLCEIFYDQDASPYYPFSSTSFEAAIASFSQSEQRYGR